MPYEVIFKCKQTMSSNTHTQTIRLFGILAERLQAVTLDFPYHSDTATLRQALETAYPVLRIHTYQIAVNHTLASLGSPVPIDAEVALLPPFSGG